MGTNNDPKSRKNSKVKSTGLDLRTGTVDGTLSLLYT